jgi:hypothetical protein
MPQTYDKIATTTLGSTASSIVFSGIAASWTDLRLVLNHLGTGAMTWWVLRLNGESGTDYAYTRLFGTGASVIAQASINDSSITVGGYNADATTTIPAFSQVDIFGYTNTSFNKGILINYNSDNNGSGNVMSYAALIRTSSAIISVSAIAQNYSFAAGTTATLYGILRA